MNEKVLEETRKNIAGFLKNRRKELELSQPALAELCGVHVNTIANMEDGKFWPNMKQFMVITHHLQCLFFLEEMEANGDYSKLMKGRWNKRTFGDRKSDE